MTIQDKNYGIILIGGGQSCGKLTASKYISNQLESFPDLKTLIEVKILDMDSYLNTKSNTIIVEMNHDSDPKLNASKVNLTMKDLNDDEEHPNREMTDRLSNKNKTILLPNRFNFAQIIKDIKSYHSTSNIFPIFIIHGLYALYDKQLNKMASMKIFIDIDADTRLVRWIQHDILQKNLNLEDLIDQYLSYSRPEFNEFIFPTKENSDTILTRGAEVNKTGLSLICDGLIPIILQKIKAKYIIESHEDDTNHHSLNSDELVIKDENITIEKLDVSGTLKLNIKGEEFNDQRGRFYDLT